MEIVSSSPSIVKPSDRPSTPAHDSKVSSTADNRANPHKSLSNHLPSDQCNPKPSLNTGKGAHIEVVASESSTPRKTPSTSKPGFPESLKGRKDPSDAQNSISVRESDDKSKSSDIKIPNGFPNGLLSTGPLGFQLPTSISSTHPTQSPINLQMRIDSTSSQFASPEADRTQDFTLSSDSRALEDPGNNKADIGPSNSPERELPFVDEKQPNSHASSPRKRLLHPAFAGHEPDKIHNYSNSELMEHLRTHIASAKAATPPITSSSQPADFSLPLYVCQDSSENGNQSSASSINDLGSVSVAADPPNSPGVSLFPVPSPQPEPQPSGISEPTTPPSEVAVPIAKPTEVLTGRAPSSVSLPMASGGSKPLPTKRNFQDLIDENKISINATKRRFNATASTLQDSPKKRSEQLAQTNKALGTSGSKLKEVDSTNRTDFRTAVNAHDRADTSSKITPRTKRPVAIDYRTPSRSRSSGHATKFHDSRPQRRPIVHYIAQGNSMSDNDDLRDIQKSPEPGKEGNCFQEHTPKSNSVSNGERAASAAEPTGKSTSEVPLSTHPNGKRQNDSVDKRTPNTLHSGSKLPTQSQSSNKGVGEDQPGNSENPPLSAPAEQAGDISPPKAVPENNEPAQEVLNGQSTNLSKFSVPELTQPGFTTPFEPKSIIKAPSKSQSPPPASNVVDSCTPGSIPDQCLSSIASESSILNPPKDSKHFQPPPATSSSVGNFPSTVDSPIGNTRTTAQPPAESIQHSPVVLQAPPASVVPSHPHIHPNQDANDCIHAEVTADHADDPNPDHDNLSTNIFGQPLITENFLSPGADEAVSIKFRNGKKKLRIRIKFD